MSLTNEKYRALINKLGHTYLRGNNRLVWITALWCLLLLLSQNNKMFIAIFLLYFCLISLIVKNIKLGLIYTYIFGLPYGEIGKTYSYYLVDPVRLGIPGLDGIGVSLVISIREVLVFIAAFLLIRDLVKHRLRINLSDKFGVLLFVLLVLKLIANMFGSVRPEISIMLFSREIGILVIYLLFIGLNIKQHIVRQNVLGIFLISVVFIAIIGVGQVINRGPLGIGVELDNSNRIVAVGSDDDLSVYRATSIFTHPNDFAIYLLSPFVLFWALSLIKGIKNRYYQLGFVLLGFGLLASGTRIVIAIALITLFMVAIDLKRLKIPIGFPSLPFNLKILLISVSTVLLINITPRFINAISAFNYYGGMETRVVLNKIALEIFQQRPFFGVGSGMVGYYIYQYYRPSDYLIVKVISYFPSPSHNSYLYLLEENGFFGLIPYVLLVWYIVRNVIIQIQIRQGVDLAEKALLVGLLYGIIAVLITSMFHTQRIWVENLFLLSIIGGIIPKKRYVI